MPRSQVRIEGIPSWLDAQRLLGVPEGVTVHNGVHEIAGEPGVAADVAARLRGVGLGGRLLTVTVTPHLGRAQVRAARLVDARRRRDATPGFERAEARTDDVGRMYVTPERLAMGVAARHVGE